MAVQSEPEFIDVRLNSWCLLTSDQHFVVDFAFLPVDCFSLHNWFCRTCWFIVSFSLCHCFLTWNVEIGLSPERGWTVIWQVLLLPCFYSQYRCLLQFYGKFRIFSFCILSTLNFITNLKLCISKFLKAIFRKITK